MRFGRIDITQRCAWRAPASFATSTATNAEASIPPCARVSDELESMLACLGESELRELQAVAPRSHAGALDQQWLAALADMRARIAARATLPVGVQKHLRRGVDAVRATLTCRSASPVSIGTISLGIPCPLVALAPA